MTKKKTKKKKTKTFTRKKVDKETGEIIEKDFFTEFVNSVKEENDDFIIPSDEYDELLQVRSWIPMPDVISKVIGAKGIPCGLITEVFGPPDAGKSTFATEVMRQTQMAGGVPVLLLSELKYDLPRAKDMGVDVTKMLIKRPKTIEEVRDQIHDIVLHVSRVNSDKPVCIVWDSLGATPCENELNEKRGDFAADQAKAITSVLRKTQAMIKDHNIAFVIVNQISTKIGVTFGKKTQSKGGFAPKFYSALRLEFAQLGRLRAKGEDQKGSKADFCAIRTKIEAVKNHVGIPFQTAELIVDYKGFVIDRFVERRGLEPKK